MDPITANGSLYNHSIIIPYHIKFKLVYPPSSSSSNRLQPSPWKTHSALQCSRPSTEAPSRPFTTACWGSPPSPSYSWPTTSWSWGGAGSTTTALAGGPTSTTPTETRPSQWRVFPCTSTGERRRPHRPPRTAPSACRLSSTARISGSCPTASTSSTRIALTCGSTRIPTAPSAAPTSSFRPRSAPGTELRRPPTGRGAPPRKLPWASVTWFELTACFCHHQGFALTHTSSSKHPVSCETRCNMNCREKVKDCPFESSSLSPHTHLKILKAFYGQDLFQALVAGTGGDIKTAATHPDLVSEQLLIF
ncbi:hypothetical protein H6P81_016230 [Aristolochia fimbriata]|uniref:Uncharacterized protein n=1 Tax=Aristolochia fimbriata TaxID=158543 RepID=A0AAV7E7N4_ARIFI|nr:hypothetical protein H6P81_016230 [Aristolochia fimbriata]